jgi:predicted Zn-dependent protease with MMP-like domain
MTAAQVAEIRDLYRSGGMSCHEIGVRFGLVSGAIYHIATGQTYAWLPGAEEAIARRNAKSAAQGNRRAYIFTHWRDRSDEEMADFLNISVSAVSNVRHRLGLNRDEVKRIRMMAAE